MYLEYSELSPFTEFRILLNVYKSNCEMLGQLPRKSPQRSDQEFKCLEIQTRLLYLVDVLDG